MSNLRDTNPQKFWKERKITDKDLESMEEDYMHSHRLKLLEIVRHLKPKSVLEVGCGIGLNLRHIKDELPNTTLTGIDINKRLIIEAVRKLRGAQLVVGDIKDLPFKDNSSDLVISDATLIYINKDEIKNVIKEMKRVAKKNIVLVEFQDEKESLINYKWKRDYSKYFKTTTFHKIRLWGDKLWDKYGSIIIADL
jgi:ubiquinone/menaquinone biosynthesis C-methylase UbiE